MFAALRVPAGKKPTRILASRPNTTASREHDFAGKTHVARNSVGHFKPFNRGELTRIAQIREHWTHNPKVEGANPSVIKLPHSSGFSFSRWSDRRAHYPKAPASSKPGCEGGTVPTGSHSKPKEGLGRQLLQDIADVRASGSQEPSPALFSSSVQPSHIAAYDLRRCTSISLKLELGPSIVTPELPAHTPAPVNHETAPLLQSSPGRRHSRIV